MDFAGALALYLPQFVPLSLFVVEPARPTGLPQRVRVPLQPARIPEQGAGLPPRARTRRRARSSAISRLGRHPAAAGGAARAAGHTGAPAEHGPPTSGAAMESILTWVSPVR